MKIDFSRYDDFNFGFAGVRIKYQPELKNFFYNFFKRVDGNSSLSKKGYQDSIVIDGEMYLLSFISESVHFYHKDNASYAMQVDDLKVLSNAMRRYLDEQYESHQNGTFFGMGSFVVPHYFCC